jgi:lipopolysaccharide transport system permease protein
MPESVAELVPPRRVTIIRPPRASAGSIVSDIAKLTQYEDLLFTLTVHRVNVRYKQSALGISWALVQPLSLMLIYTLIFSVVARVPTDGQPYAVFAYAALLPWTFFATGLTNATSGLVNHSYLVTKVYFPREILPLSYIAAALVDLAAAATVFLGLLLYYHIDITLQIIWVIPIILILICFLTAVSLFFSATQVRFRDVGVAMPLLLQLWMFATPVVYPLSLVPARFRRLYELNPLVGLIESFRQVTVRGESPDVRLLFLSGVLSIALLFVCWLYFKHVEATIADVI